MLYLLFPILIVITTHAQGIHQFLSGVSLNYTIIEGFMTTSGGIFKSVLNCDFCDEGDDMMKSEY